MIEKMTHKYEKELTDFLYEHNSLKEYFVAWIPENYGEISALDKKDRIVGCLGTYISYEQKAVRLLGPVIDREYCQPLV